MKNLIVVSVAVLGASFSSAAVADTTNALIMNQFNAVSGGSYLDSGKFDTQLGRVEGNGQNWLQLLTTKADPGKNTLNLQGYEIDWSYNKSDGTSSGSGVIKFSNDPVWSNVPLGTAITINEYQKVWYLNDTPPNPPNVDGDPTGSGGMQRDGGIDGLGVQHGTPYSNDPNLETLIDFSSNTAWNPYAPAGANMAPGPNWNINVWAGQGPAGNVGNNYNYQYFTFSGTVTKNGVTSQIGTEAAGLFAANNDNWQFTIKDNNGNTVQGPIGEALKNTGGWGGNGVGSGEIGKLQGFEVGSNPTLADWQNVQRTNYFDGSTSRYGGPTQWTVGAGTATEDLSPLRNWFNDIRPGDVNLDGIVNGQDIALAASSWLQIGTNLMAGDANGDGIINGQDIALMASDWLQTGGAPAPAFANAAAVPEPATCLLCLIGIAVAVGTRWRGRGV